MNPIQYIKNLIKQYRYKCYEEEYYNLSEQEQSYWTLEMFQMQREAIDVFFRYPSPCAMLTLALMDRARQPQWAVLMKVMDTKMRQDHNRQSFVMETMYTEILEDTLIPAA
ncbi:hypothetical protein P5G61_05820 [Paenibacillus sp. F6_3S_P_1C]|jgi:hypothetical protein|uniref:Uncharacterized protein n=1 Tax=Paenibacillus vandeheii TaxID=3035917 RepID=A0ABT8J6U6_9BACL|nr:hypothetical protein [Paenibacillus vandeheii]MDN4600735.1 hypothetical protein [Paenibacillus vandeheii]